MSAEVLHPSRRPVLPFLDAARDTDVALVSATATLTYADLRRRVTERRDVLGGVRRVVLLEAGNDVESVVTYLAALAGRHPLLMVGPGDRHRWTDLVERYRPDVVQDATGLHAVRSGTVHDLHPDLALLLSTSGSTGSPKLVRLSLENLLSNAESIATYLELRSSDRAVTSLPLHYCYGLSVLNSHLARGAGVVLSELSVADECFWDLVREQDVSTLAGVPYSFELLEASGFERRELPRLRLLTQAGGRMDPARVTAFAELGRRRGFDLVVMYGQTEATARMAYLPADLVASRPQAVGIAVPGGRLSLRPVDDLVPQGQEPDVGELVYEGPNVMLGYAEDAQDLALGRTVSALRTGDLARQADDGLFEVVGRLNRQAKVFGLRLDLERVERLLAERGHVARVVASDRTLAAYVDRPRSAALVRAQLLEVSGLPASAVRVEQLERLPVTTTGKPDHAVLVRHLRLLEQHESELASPTSAVRELSPEGIRDLFAELLGRPDAGVDDSFAALGGDSLSYVEVSVRLSSALDDLPPGWAHLTPVELAAAAARRRRAPRWWRRHVVRVDASIVLRAVAIVMVLASHADLVRLAGGAHVLLAVAGYNLARFQLGLPDRRARVAGVLSGAWRVALPAFLWIGTVALVTSAYDTPTVFLLNGVLGRDTWDDDWQFWFIEALVLGYLALVVLLLLPWVDRVVQRRPFAAATGVLLCTLAVRYATVGVEAGPTERYSVVVVLWCIALGWAAAAARGVRQHALVAVLAVVATAGFFADGRRETIVVLGVLLLLADRPVPLPRPLAAVVALVAAASLWIYLTQWQVYPGLEDAGWPVLAVVASVVAGLAAHVVYTRVSDLARVGAWRLTRPASAPRCTASGPRRAS